MLFTQRSTILPAAALVAASLLTFTSAAPSFMMKRDALARRGNDAMVAEKVEDGDKPRPPPNPAEQGENQIGPTNLYTLTFNTDPMTSVDSVVSFDPSKYGGKEKSGYGGYCRHKDTYGCLAMSDGKSGVLTSIYQCTEIDSSEAGKKALVWKKSSTCQLTNQGYGSMQTNICVWNGKGPDCKPIGK